LGQLKTGLLEEEFFNLVMTKKSQRWTLLVVVLVRIQNQKFKI
jgi:hypothetical protein